MAAIACLLGSQVKAGAKDAPDAVAHKDVRDSDRDLMIQSIGHVWDANETWLVALGGALFGAFPDAYSMILSDLKYLLKARDFC